MWTVAVPGPPTSAVRADVLQPGGKTGITGPPVGEVTFSNILCFKYDLPGGTNGVYTFSVTCDEQLPPVGGTFRLSGVPDAPPVADEVPTRLPYRTLIVTSTMTEIRFSTYADNDIIPALRTVPACRVATAVVRVVGGLPVLKQIESVSSTTYNVASGPAGVGNAVAVATVVPPVPPVGTKTYVRFRPSKLGGATPVGDGMPAGGVPGATIF